MDIITNKPYILINIPLKIGAVCMSWLEHVYRAQIGRQSFFSYYLGLK